MDAPEESTPGRRSTTTPSPFPQSRAAPRFCVINECKTLESQLIPSFILFFFVRPLRRYEDLKRGVSVCLSWLTGVSMYHIQKWLQSISSFFSLQRTDDMTACFKTSLKKPMGRVTDSVYVPLQILITIQFCPKSQKCSHVQDIVQEHVEVWTDTCSVG